jgi:hypothetical protein
MSHRGQYFGSVKLISASVSQIRASQTREEIPCQVRAELRWIQQGLSGFPTQPTTGFSFIHFPLMFEYFKFKRFPPSPKGYLPFIIHWRWVLIQEQVWFWAKLRFRPAAPQQLLPIPPQTPQLAFWQPVWDSLSLIQAVIVWYCIPFFAICCH